MYRNKLNEDASVVRNKARLVAQGYRQEERIDFNQMYTLVARLKAIRIFLVYSSFKNFEVYQIDVKSAFLNGQLQEELYFEQPLGFVNHLFSDHVYHLKKDLYDLKQASRALYETLSKFLIDHDFFVGLVDKTLIKFFKGKYTLLVQIYVDDIIFGSTNPKLFDKFAKLMQEKFEMSMMG